MEVFFKTRKQVAKSLYENDIKKNLRNKDGFKHLILINGQDAKSKKDFQCRERYTYYMDYIIGQMQREGYEIIDIQLNVNRNTGFFEEVEDMDTLIVYK